MPHATMGITLPTEINIITLNCWGLKFISKLRDERLTEIGRRIASAAPRPHIVALQECFTQEDYETVRRETRSILPYGKFYFSGPFGGGLAILSHWPIEESTMLRYPLNGRPTAFWRGDWYVGKGIACAKIRYGPGPKDIIEVFNTHTHAPYEDSYLCHRLAQSWEMSKLLRGATERGHLVLGLGDFNMRPASLPHRLITAHATLVRDAWRLLHPDSSLGTPDDPLERARRRPVPTADFNLLENGATSDSVYCTWRWSADQQRRLSSKKKSGSDPYAVPPHALDPKGKRLDYVFVADGQRATSPSRRHGNARDGASTRTGWVVKSAKVGMVEPHPRLGCSLSDHFSVEVTIAYHTSSNQRRSPQTRDDPPTRPQAGTGTTKVAHGTAAIDNVTSYLQSPTASETGSQSDHPPTHDRDASQSENNNPRSSHRHAVQRRPPQQSRPLSAPLTPAPELASESDLDLQLDPTHYPAHQDNAPLPSSAYDDVLSTIRAYVRREQSQRRLRAAHFFVWFALWLASLAGIWFVPSRLRFFNFLLLLLGSLGLVAGVVDGLMALLFFGSELRALREFEWEILNAKASAAGGAGPGVVGEDGKVQWERGW
ncbi:DNase I-like protein [Sodiomyces alkalinus F11]|uniref:DNase I-like protein n=1 Tax=Sodiomyces alkalinus (strain CBS 110278 / VKM F-3762 / F11) TaxID=1314773 RepID=A0A3N2PZL5_SODAK|nr:DNase I-like protein [Sodiomyces alkalinus F11]ROT39795.1 DNase I-like protein [Sodiomyces alkalinus F11]